MTTTSELPDPKDDDPAAVLAVLKNGATSRKRRSLDIIDSVCRRQAQQEKFDFSWATIGRRSEAEGGPGPSTIYNRSGIPYRMLISAWAKSLGTTTKKPRKPNVTQADRPSSKDHAVLERIEDPALRQYLSAMLAERDDLRRQVDTLAKQPVEVDWRAGKPTNGGTVVEPITDVLTEQEIYAIEDAISDDKQEDMGWRMEDDGRVRDADGESVFAPGFVSAVQKLVQRKGRET